MVSSSKNDQGRQLALIEAGNVEAGEPSPAANSLLK